MLVINRSRKQLTFQNYFTVHIWNSGSIRYSTCLPPRFDNPGYGPGGRDTRPIIKSASDFFSLLAKKISHNHSGDERETAFLFQRVPVLVQRFNGVLLHDSFVFEDCPE